MKKNANLITPYVLPNGVILRNRLTAAASTNNLLQGTHAEYPMNEIITMMTNRAKNGAAMITITGIVEKYNAEFFKGMNLPYEFTLFDLKDEKNRNKFCELTEAIHMEQSKAILQLIPFYSREYDVSPNEMWRFGMSEAQKYKELTKDMLTEIKEAQIEWAKYAKACGFDGVLVHMCYGLSVAARLLSNRYNHRTDEYGGSLENRCRFALEICEGIKKACGNSFIVEAVITGNDVHPDGWKIEDSIAFAKMAEGKIDMLQIRHAEADPSHPTGYSKNPYPMMADAAAIKAGGVNIAIETIGGYNDIDIMEDVIASGKADFIATARSWISNPEFGKLIEEGRNEDVIPCIRCNKCHSRPTTDKFMPVTNCSVNPIWGLEHRITQMFDAPIGKKKVAVIGGGPIGMRAALFVSDRGHDVILYEKTDKLGGLLNCTDGISFKWPINKYKNWLVAQIEKRENVTVCLQTEATKKLLQENAVDTVLISVGSTPVIPNIPGIENAKSCIEMFGKETEISKDVVIIGGGDIGVDMGMHLAENGHNVTVLEATDQISAGNKIVHTYTLLWDAIAELPTFTYETQAKIIRISPNGVVYENRNGEKKVKEAGTILYAVGVRPNADQAVALTDSTSYVSYFIGDCVGMGDLQHGNRSAYGAANRI